MAHISRMLKNGLLGWVRTPVTLSLNHYEKLIPITLLIYYNKVSSYHKQVRQQSTHPALQQVHNLVVTQHMRGLFGCIQDQRDP